MEVRFANSPEEYKLMTTASLRNNFLVTNLMKKDTPVLVYSHFDRVVIGGIMPVNKSVLLSNEPELRSEFFLERREMGIINLGGPGTITANGNAIMMDKLSCLYLGKGTRKISFGSRDKKSPALFYFLSAPAHAVYPNTLYTKKQASPVLLGTIETSNKRTVYKYIHPEGIKSCQLVMGLTILEPGCVWNSIPPHTHTRRMEVYYYFDLPDSSRVFHFMGSPQETRHLVVSNNEAVISPPWSTHFGSGTSSYGFVWGMAGENLTYTDMDPAPVVDLK